MTDHPPPTPEEFKQFCKTTAREFQSAMIAAAEMLVPFEQALCDMHSMLQAPIPDSVEVQNTNRAALLAVMGSLLSQASQARVAFEGLAAMFAAIDEGRA